MPATLTVTGKVGPGNTVTAGVFTGVTNININTVNNMLQFTQDAVVKEIDVNAADTVTATKSGTTWTLTIS